MPDAAFKFPFSVSSIPEVPTWLYDRQGVNDNEATGSSGPLSEATPSSADSGRRAFAMSALADECQQVATTVAGGRSDRLNAAAFSLGQLVAANVLDGGDVRDSLYQAAFTNGHVREDGPRAVRATIESGLRAGVANPRDLSHVGQRSVFSSSGRIGPAHSETRPGPVFEWDDADAPPVVHRYLVRNLMPEGPNDPVLLCGQPKAGKSACALDLSVSVALGVPFFGQKIERRGGTLFLLGEGAATMRDRLSAIHQGKLDGNTYIDPGTGEVISTSRLPILWTGAANLANAAEFTAAIDIAIRAKEELETRFHLPLRMIIVDTVMSAFGFPDGDPDASRVFAAMKDLARLSEATGALVVGIHHYGKNAESGAFGSYAWTAGASAVVAVTADRDGAGGAKNRKISLPINRFGREGWSHAFDLQDVPLGTFDDGETFGAPIVVPVAETIIAIPSGPRLSPAGRRYVDCVRSALERDGECIEGAPADKMVDRSKVRDIFFDSHPVTGETLQQQSDAKRKAFANGEKNAREKRRVGTTDVGTRTLVYLLENDANRADTLMREGGISASA